MEEVSVAKHAQCHQTIHHVIDRQLDFKSSICQRAGPFLLLGEDLRLDPRLHRQLSRFRTLASLPRALLLSLPSPLLHVRLQTRGTHRLKETLGLPQDATLEFDCHLQVKEVNYRALTSSNLDDKHHCQRFLLFCEVKSFPSKNTH